MEENEYQSLPMGLVDPASVLQALHRMMPTLASASVDAGVKLNDRRTGWDGLLWFTAEAHQLWETAHSEVARSYSASTEIGQPPRLPRQFMRRSIVSFPSGSRYGYTQAEKHINRIIPFFDHILPRTENRKGEPEALLNRA
jgi:hypothetical protein